MGTPKYVKEPPESERGKYPREPWPGHADLVKACRRRPGRWVEARTFEFAPSASRFASNIRNGKYLAFQEGTWEAVARDNTVYVRYIRESTNG